MSVCQQFNRARRTHRTATDHGIKKLQRLAVVILKQRRGDLGGGGFPAIKAGQLLFGGIVIEHKSPATQTGGLGFGQPQHRLYRYHGVYGAATGFQYLIPGFNRIGVGGGHHKVFAGDGAFGVKTAGGFRVDLVAGLSAG